MAIKRKFDVDFEDAVPHNAKQLKLVPFPNFEADEDTMMFDAEPLFSDVHHSRLSSTTSSASSNSSSSPLSGSPAASYPTFDIYPMPFFNAEGSVNTKSHDYSHITRSLPSPSVGLLQPTSAFVHHGTGCSQVPKLRVACNPGLNGQRTMWSFCEQCGAISMVESD